MALSHGRKLRLVLMVMVVRVEVARRSSTPSPEFYYQYIDRNVVDITNRGGDVFTSLQVRTQ